MEGRTSSLGSAQQFYVAVSSSEVKLVRLYGRVLFMSAPCSRYSPVWIPCAFTGKLLVCADHTGGSLAGTTGKWSLWMYCNLQVISSLMRADGLSFHSPCAFGCEMTCTDPAGPRHMRQCILSRCRALQLKGCSGKPCDWPVTHPAHFCPVPGVYPANSAVTPIGWPPAEIPVSSSAA